MWRGGRERFVSARHARARADARPLPRPGGLRRARRRAPSTRSTATASPPCPCCRPGRSSTRGSGRRRSPTWRVTSGWSPSTGAERPLRRPRRGRYTDVEFADDALPCWTPPTPSARCSSRCRAARLGDAARGRSSGARPGLVSIGPAIPLAPGTPSGRSPFEASSPATGWAKYNRHYWQRDYRGFLEFFFAQMFPEPHSTKQIEDCVGWALETDPEMLADTTRGAATVRARAVRATSATRVALPGAGDPRRRRPHPAARPGRRPRRADRRRARDARGRRPRPAGARPGEGQPAAARLHRARRAPRGARRGRAAAAGAGGRCSSPRRSASGHARATWRSRASCARCTPTSRSTGSPSTRSRACSRREGERIHPASARAGQRVGATSSPSRPSTTCTASRRGGGWTRSCVANFMVFHDVVARGARTTSGSATRPGSVDYFLHENPELKRAAYAWLTDFVGWLPMPTAASARRPDRRLQRRDDRAHRPLPARARPRAVRRQPRRHRARALRPGAAGDPRLDRARTSTSPATSPASTRPRSPTASGCARELGYAPDEQVCIVTVGGSGVGAHLLRRVIAAFPARQGSGSRTCA